MKTIEFVSPEKSDILCAEEWLKREGFKVLPLDLAVHLDSELTRKKIVRYDNGYVGSYNHAVRNLAERYYTLSAFKQAILEDMETTTKTKEEKKADYKDICIEFDTREQAQVFAEAVHKNGHSIRFWEEKYLGSIIKGYGDGSLSRDNHYASAGQKHISEAPAEWLRFLLSPAKPALKVAGHDVKITAEDAKIGCTTVTWEEVKSVYKAMKEARS